MLIDQDFQALPPLRRPGVAVCCCCVPDPGTRLLDRGGDGVTVAVLLDGGRIVVRTLRWADLAGHFEECIFCPDSGEWEPCGWQCREADSDSKNALWASPGRETATSPILDRPGLQDGRGQKITPSPGRIAA